MMAPQHQAAARSVPGNSSQAVRGAAAVRPAEADRERPDGNPGPTPWNMLLAIFLLAFMLRLGYALVERVPVQVDARIYNKIAVNLMQGQGFAESPGLPRNQDGSIRVVGPLYPVFLGALYWLLGPHVWIVWIVQALLGAATCLVLAHLGKGAFGWTVGVVTAVLAALAFDLVIFPAMLLTETLYLFLASLALLGVNRALAAHSAWWSLVAGLVIGLGALTRPTILLFAGFIVLWQVGRNSWRTAAPLFLGIALMLLPWGLRNSLIYGEFVMVSPNGGWNFWLGANPEADGSYPSTLPPDILRVLDQTPFLQQSRIGYSRGLQFIRDHPAQYARILAMKLMKYFSIVRTNGWMLYMRGVDRMVSIFLSALTTLVLLSLGLLGFFQTVGRRDGPWVGLTLYAASCLLSAMIYTVHARYRLLIYPALLLFASNGLVELWRCCSQPGSDAAWRSMKRAVAVALGIVLTATTLDALTAASEIQRRLALLLGL